MNCAEKLLEPTSYNLLNVKNCSINTHKISINRITEFIVIFKIIGKCFCMRFSFVYRIVHWLFGP